MLDLLMLGLSVVLAGAVIVLAQLRPNLVLGSLRKRYADDFRQALEIGPLCYVTDTELPRLQSMKRPLVGAFLQRGRSLSFIGANKPGDVPKRVFWNLDHVDLTLIGASAMSLGVPDLIRVAQNGDVHFFFAKNALGSVDKKKTLAHFEKLRSVLGTLNHDVREAEAGKGPMLIGVAGMLLLVALLLVSATRQGGLIGPRLVAPDQRGGVFVAGGDDIAAG